MMCVKGPTSSAAPLLRWEVSAWLAGLFPALGASAEPKLEHLRAQGLPELPGPQEDLRARGDRSAGPFLARELLGPAHRWAAGLLPGVTERLARQQPGP